MINRNQAIELLAPLIDDQIIITSLGANSHLLHQIKPRPLNCYMRGGMGLCSSYGLGVALAKPDTQVICLDGDGSVLMNLGTLCTIGSLRPKNLSIIVYDNKAFYGEPTATASNTDLAKIAKSSGFIRASSVSDINGLSRAYKQYLNEEGPNFLSVEIKLLDDRTSFNYEQEDLIVTFKEALARE